MMFISCSEKKEYWKMIGFLQGGRVDVIGFILGMLSLTCVCGTPKFWRSWVGNWIAYGYGSEIALKIKAESLIYRWTQKSWPWIRLLKKGGCRATIWWAPTTTSWIQKWSLQVNLRESNWRNRRKTGEMWYERDQEENTFLEGGRWQQCHAHLRGQADELKCLLDFGGNWTP